MFQTAPGCSIPHLNQIREEYEVRERHSLLANVSFPNLAPLVTEFYRSLPEPLFFVMHLPLSQQEERQLCYPPDRHYQEVLYLDHQTRAQIDAIMDSYGPLLLADGISQFAIASHTSNQEIFVQKFKIVSIFAPQPRDFIPLVERYGLRQVPRVTTAWDTISRSSAAECTRISYEGMDAYMVAEALKKQGMYRSSVEPSD